MDERIISNRKGYVILLYIYFLVGLIEVLYSVVIGFRAIEFGIQSVFFTFIIVFIIYRANTLKYKIDKDYIMINNKKLFFSGIQGVEIYNNIVILYKTKNTTKRVKLPEICFKENVKDYIEIFDSIFKNVNIDIFRCDFCNSSNFTNEVYKKNEIVYLNGRNLPRIQKGMIIIVFIATYNLLVSIVNIIESFINSNVYQYIGIMAYIVLLIFSLVSFYYLWNRRKKFVKAQFVCLISNMLINIVNVINDSSLLSYSNLHTCVFVFFTVVLDIILLLIVILYLNTSVNAKQTLIN